MRGRQLTQCRRTGVWLLLACWMVGCGGSEESVENLTGLYQQIYTAEPFVVVPGRRWDVDRAGEGWSFRTFASLWWSVTEPLDSSVTVVLRPTPEMVGYHYLLTWDGEERFGELIALPEGDLELEIPAEWLTPGRHELRLKRRFGPTDAQGPLLVDNTLGAMGTRYGDRVRWLERSQLDTYRALASFLEFGATGHDQEKRAGFLFLEPHSLSVPLDRGEPATLQVVGENLGEGQATFAIEVDGERSEQVASGPSRVAFRVPLGGGHSQLRFEVSGEATGPFLWGAPVVAGEPERLPPVILLSLDTTRRDALSPYGAAPEITPSLATFAGQATVFDRAFSTAPWTLPSHASMFTGLYPSRHGAGVSRDKLDGSLPTLARILRDHGYYTAGFAGGPLAAHRFGLGQGFHQYRDPDGKETVGDRMTSYAEQVIEDHRDQPFFLFLNYFDPHGPYQVREEMAEIVGLESYRQAVPDLERWRPAIEGRAGTWDKLAAEGPIPEAVLAYLRATYLSEVAFLDAQIGRLFDTLRQADLYDRSLIVITADHGQLLGEGGFHSHGKRLDPELIDAPLMIKWPRQQSGGRVADLVSIVDVYPTILKTLGLPSPPGDGRALRPDGVLGERDYVVMEEHESLVHPLRGPMKVAAHLYGLQEPDFRHVWWEGGAQCARWADNAWLPADCPEDDERRAALELALASPREELIEGAEPLSEDDRAKLEALGYL